MKRRLLAVSTLLFCSGLSALVYQVAWMRELRLIFGFSTAASAAVVAIFLAGLGAGGWLLGRRADAAPRPLAFYGWLELGIAAAAAITPLLVLLVRLAYIALGGTQSLGLFGGTLARLLFSAVVLAVPTVLMGGTLPAAARAVATDEDAPRRSLAVLYGANTLGALVGTFLSTFLLLELFGTRTTLWLACALNALVGLLAVRLSRDSGEAEPSEAPKPKKDKRRRKEAEPPLPLPGKVSSGLSAAPATFVLAAAATVGFAFMLMELVWYRMLSPLLGGSTYTFGLILAVALLGIGVGSAVYSRAGGGSATLAGFAATCAVEAFFLALPWALGDRIALFAILVRPFGAFGFAGYVAGWSLVAGIVILPPAVAAGYQFPLLIALLGRGRDRVGRDVGLAYAWNTFGGILGALAGGFGLLPLLSATGTWAFVALFLSLLAAAALLLSWRKEKGKAVRPRRWFPVAGVAATLLLLTAEGPTAAWRHSPIGAGRVDLGKANPNLLREWLSERRRQLIWEEDGVESSVALLATSGGHAFALSGKIDGTSREDAGTQVMSGLIGAALHPDPRRALVIGLGTGSTAGWLGAVPSMTRVDVVELEPAILRVARDCSPVNQNVLANPRVRIAIGDAREWLLTSRERYDLIFSEPSNPYRAGISSLFTEEFYRAARSRLQEKGIFLQWLQAYEVDSGTVRAVYATVTAVFPEVETYYTRDNDLLLVASTAPIAYEAAALRARLGEEPWSSAMRNAWRVAGLEGFLSHYVARSSLARALASEERTVNTDDRNAVEFAFARSLGRDSFFDVSEMRRAARARGEDRPVVSGDLDWQLVDRFRVSTVTADNVLPRLRPDLDLEALRQTLAQRSFLEGRPEAVLANWRAQPWEPRGDVEELVLAEALAQGADERALDTLSRFESSHKVEAAAVLARLRWRQGRFEEAAQALERAFVLYRADPWPLRAVIQNAFPIALDLAGKDPALAARLEVALSKPFSLSLLEEERSRVRLDVASFLDLPRYAAALAPLEPHVPWRREILERRARAYEATGNPRTSVAKRELEEFLENEPPPFSPGLAEPGGVSAPPPLPARTPPSP